ncbi:hypothetical protein [Mucilaginibacter sp.]
MLNHDTQIAQSVFKLYIKADDPINALKFAQYMPDQQKTGSVLKKLIGDEALLKAKPANSQVKQQITNGFKQLGIDTLK